MKRPHASHGSKAEGLEITSAAALEHLLEHHPQNVRTVWLASREPNQRLQKIAELARQAKVHVDMSGAQRGVEPVRALVVPAQFQELGSFLERMADKKRATVVALDHLQDPHNFGAICRTAVGLGIDGILIPKDRSVAVTPGVYHSSVGTVQSIPIVQVSNLSDGLRKLKDKGFWILGTAINPEGKAPWEAPDFEKAVLVLGAELEGLSPGIEKQCDWQMQIPISDRVQSYNVSVAGAILMYEWQRRKFTAPTA